VAWQQLNPLSTWSDEKPLKEAFRGKTRKRKGIKLVITDIHCALFLHTRNSILASRGS
jgi:hypothetical protein